MTEWNKVRLDQVVELQRGHDLPIQARRSGSIPVLGSNGVVGFHDEAPYAGPGVTIGRSGVIGGATYTAEPYWPLNTCLFVKDFKGNDTRWVYYWLKSADFSAMDSGSAQPSLNRNYIASLPVLLPSKAEQKAIAALLGALDDKIAANNESSNAADSLAVAIAQKAFKNSQSATLADIAIITMGSSPKGETLNEVQEGSVFYQGIRDFGLRHPNRRVWTTSPVRMAQTSDTLLSVRAPVGSVNIAQENLCIGRGLASLRSIQKTPYALFHAVKQAPIWQQYNAEGTVFGTITRKQLAAAQVSWKAPEQLMELEEKLRPLEELIAQIIEESKTLAELRDLLLPQLMSGKLRLKDAEAFVESVI